MTEQDWRVIALVGLPVVAAVCLGMIIRAFVDYEGDYWWLWVLVLALVCMTWVYVFRRPL